MILGAFMLVGSKYIRGVMFLESGIQKFELRFSHIGGMCDRRRHWRSTPPRNCSFGTGLVALLSQFIFLLGFGYKLCYTLFTNTNLPTI